MRLGSSENDWPYLTELFYPGDDATHDAAYHPTDWIPTAHPQASEGATGHTQQDVTDRMFSRSRQCPAAAIRHCRRRNGVVGNHADDRYRDRTRVAFGPTSAYARPARNGEIFRTRGRSPRQSHASPVRAARAVLSPRRRHRGLVREWIRRRLSSDQAQAYRAVDTFGLKVAKLNAGRCCQGSNGRC